MRVVEPHEFRGVKHPKKKKKNRSGLRVFLALIIFIYVAASLLRPIPAINATVQLPEVAAAREVSLLWPTYGQSAVGAVGYGVLGTNGDQQPLPIASVAKVMTALAILKAKPLAQGQSGPLITFTQDDVDYYYQTVALGGSNSAVELGAEISQYEALQALLLPSSNNMAYTLAKWAYGSEADYVQFANNFAKTLGMTNTTFADASGYSAETVSTASDLTRLAVNAMDNPVIAEIAAQEQAIIPVAGTIYNVNSLLGRNNIIGLKTGNTAEAGGCFMAAAVKEINGQRIIAVSVIMGAAYRDLALQDSVPLVNSVLNNFEPVTVVTANQTVGSYSAHSGKSVTAKVQDTLQAVRWAGSDVSPEVRLDKLQGAVAQDTKVGSVMAIVGRTTLESHIIIDNPLPEPSWTDKFIPRFW
jgi:D-alanyl-D-alanine carboxypeptidase (penicillin-binding protein 5/6)